MGFHYNGSCEKCPSGCSECFYAVFQSPTPPKENYTLVSNFTLLTTAQAQTLGLKLLCGKCARNSTIYVDLITCKACPSFCTDCFYSNGRDVNLMQIYLSPSIPTSSQLTQKGASLVCSDCIEGYSINLNQLCVSYSCSLKNCLVCKVQQTISVPKTNYYTCLKCEVGYSIFSYENQTTNPPQRYDVCKNCGDFFNFCLECQRAQSIQGSVGGGGGGPGGGGGGGAPMTVQYTCNACQGDKVLSSVNYESKCLSCENCVNGMCSVDASSGKVFFNINKINRETVREKKINRTQELKKTKKYLKFKDFPLPKT